MCDFKIWDIPLTIWYRRVQYSYRNNKKVRFFYAHIEANKNENMNEEIRSWSKPIRNTKTRVNKII